VAEYVEIMKRESGITLSPNLVINENRAKDLIESTYGGILLTACQGKIVCDNTMQARLTLVYQELLPAIRAILFPEDQ
jgi:V-type H+-transporting ATPase subunit E